MTSDRLPRLENYIGGEFSPPTESLSRDICDANTGQRLQSQKGVSLDGAAAALEAADSCYRETNWEQDVNSRIAALNSMADYLARPENIDTVARADALTTGVILSTTRKLAGMIPILFRHAADMLSAGVLEETREGPLGGVTCFRRAWGPALLISPWNGPTPIGAHKLASAIAAGAPAITKPSVWTPHSAIIMAKAAHAAGLPNGAVNLVMGDRNSARTLLHDPRVKSVSFTGGLGGGQAVAKACADTFRPTQLELGGNNALVVLDGADLDKAADGIVFGLANLNGQWCRALGRIIVSAPLKSKLLDKVMARLSVLKLGSSLDENSEMGPQAHVKQYDDVLRAIDGLTHLGGSILSATKLPALDGYFVAPTIIDGCKPEDTRDENFGPVAVIHTFDTESEALALANDPPFGLAGYVFGPESAALKFAREMRTGGVKVNGYSLLALRSDFPRGAWEQSGLGEEGGRESLMFFTGSRVVGVSPQDKLGG